MLISDRAAVTIVALKQILALEPADELWTEAEQFLRDEYAEVQAAAVADRSDPQPGGDIDA